MAEPDLDLELVPTEALVDELLDRCDHGVVILRRDRADGRSAWLWWNWSGDGHTISGALGDVAQQILDQTRAEGAEGGPGSRDSEYDCGEDNGS